MIEILLPVFNAFEDVGDKELRRNEKVKGKQRQETKMDSVDQSTQTDKLLSFLKRTIDCKRQTKGNDSDSDRLEEQHHEEKKTIDELRDVILPKELTVTGIYETGHYLHDSEFLLVPIYVGQELYGLGDALHGITVKTDNPYSAERVKSEIENFLTPPEFAETWIDMNHQYFEAVRLERTVMFFLLFFIVVVAAFGIMSTLITVTVQKRREIGIMKALGANLSQIVWVFLGQGTVVGLFGTLTGLGLGMTLIRYRNEFSSWLASTLHIEIFPREVYQFSSIPAEVIPKDVAIICISAFLICSFAALIPAYFAARLDPVKALRYE